MHVPATGYVIWNPSVPPLSAGGSARCADVAGGSGRVPTLKRSAWGRLRTSLCQVIVRNRPHLGCKCSPVPVSHPAVGHREAHTALLHVVWGFVFTHAKLNVFWPNTCRTCRERLLDNLNSGLAPISATWALAAMQVGCVILHTIPAEMQRCIRFWNSA